MTSTSSDGCSVITLRFALELDIDIAVQRFKQLSTWLAVSCLAICPTRRCIQKPTPRMRRY